MSENSEIKQQLYRDITGLKSELIPVFLKDKERVEGEGRPFSTSAWWAGELDDGKYPGGPVFHVRALLLCFLFMLSKRAPPPRATPLTMPLSSPPTRAAYWAGAHVFKLPAPGVRHRPCGVGRRQRVFVRVWVLEWCAGAARRGAARLTPLAAAAPLLDSHPLPAPRASPQPSAWASPAVTASGCCSRSPTFSLAACSLRSGACFATWDLWTMETRRCTPTTWWTTRRIL
jgi:hypothetical protein